jgi:hypothetical protein
MTSISQCPDLMLSGNCTKGEDCPFCKNNSTDVNLNVNAKNYVPKSKRNNLEENFSEININKNTDNLTSTNLDDKTDLKFNLNANEYKPKPVEKVEEEEEELDEEDIVDEEIAGEEFDMIMKDIANENIMEEMEEDESDDEKWFPKFRECECCKGFVYKCKGDACQNLGACYCKMKKECDEDSDEEDY